MRILVADCTVDYEGRLNAHLPRARRLIVVKADGLAAGKGVIVARTNAVAEAAVEDMLAGNAFGDAGHRLVIEEYLEGEEASFIVMADGRNILPLATSQDHKAVGDGDTGPNTGGMGAYSPVPAVDEKAGFFSFKVIMPCSELRSTR